MVNHAARRSPTGGAAARSLAAYRIEQETVDDPSGVLGWPCVRCACKAALILASSINEDNPSGEVLALLRYAFTPISEGVL
jgi:hypothetical protein